MAEKSVGKLLLDARLAKKWTRAELAAKVGYKPVMISKLETGERLPSEDKIPVLVDALGVSESRLRAAMAAAAGEKAGSLKIVDAMKLAKQNSAEATRLKQRAEALKESADATARKLDDSVREFDAQVLAPFSRVVARIQDVPEEVVVRVDGDAHAPNSKFAESLKQSQFKTSSSIFSLMGAGLLGGTAGVGLGAGAATATYMTVASIATASTGTEIASLSGAAAASATLAAIGGGSLAAGGLGIAGGTAILTGIVALPALGVAAGAALASGGRILERQLSIQHQIRAAAHDFEQNAIVVTRFGARAARINEILTVAILAARNHLRVIATAIPEESESDDKLSWSSLDSSPQASIQRLAEIVLACVTALSLPIGMSAKQVAPEVASTADSAEGSIPQIKPSLEVGAEDMNEFIDFVIDESFSQVAR